MRRILLAMGLGLGLSSVVWAHRGGTPEGASPLIRHEPLPARQGLMAGTSTEPVLELEEGGELSALPGEITAGGVRRPAPAGTVAGTGEDLVYVVNTSAVDMPGVVHNVQDTVRPDRATGREPWLNYHAVFDPALIPFKRNSAKDRVMADGGLVTGDPAMAPIPVTGNRTDPEREVFWGSVLLELQSGLPVPLPSVSPESRILSVETVPEVSLRFYKDGADNVYATSPHTGRVRVNFVMDAPKHWFVQIPRAGMSAADVPEALRPVLPPAFVAAAKKVARAAGVRRSDDYGVMLERLVYWFRAFRPGDLRGDDASGATLYETLALAQKGVCRHRVYGFVITAQSLGIPARYVSNEAHVFAEVFVPDAGWLRMDLGGAARGMNVRNAGGKTRHEVAEADPFGFPPGFRAGYSQRAQAGASGRGAGDSGAGDSGAGDSGAGDEVSGLPPRGESAGRVGDPEAPGDSAARPGRSGSVFGAPRLVSRPDPSRMGTTTVLEEVSPRVFRGDKLALRGRVRMGPDAVGAGRVRVVLTAPGGDGDAVVRVLGYATTGPDGRFDAQVTVPPQVGLGNWEVIAEFVGDERRSPSHSR